MLNADDAAERWQLPLRAFALMLALVGTIAILRISGAPVDPKATIVSIVSRNGRRLAFQSRVGSEGSF